MPHCLAQIDKLQKRALRVISSQGYRSHHIPLCFTLQTLDLEHIYELKALSFLYDYYHDKLPPFLHNKLIFYYNRHNELCLKTQYRRTDIASSSLFHTLPNIWNPLPNNLKLSILNSKQSFLREFKNYIFSKYEVWRCCDRFCYVCGSGNI